MTRLPDMPTDATVQRDRTRLQMDRIMLAWVFGAAWLALVTGAPLIRFSEEMGLKRYQWTWGLLSAMPFVGTFFQLLGSWWIERYRSRKFVFFAGFLVQRLTWLVVAALPWMVVPDSLAAIASVLGLVLMHALSGAVAVPAWTSWMADVIPQRLRGRYFGVRGQMGRAVMIPVALAVGWLLSASRTGSLRIPYPTGLTEWHWWQRPLFLTTVEVCSILFAIGAVLGLLDLLCFVRVPDEPEGGRLVRPPGWRQILGPPLRDREFGRLLMFHSMLVMGATGIGSYVWLYFLNDLGVHDMGAQAVFLIAPLIGGVLVGKLWGNVIDRAGRKAVFVISTAGVMTLPAWWIAIGPGYWWAGAAITFIGGICWNGLEQSVFNSMLHFARPQQSRTGEEGQAGSSSYQAVFALATSLAGAASGVIFGLLAEVTKGLDLHLGQWSIHPYHLLFWLAVGMRVFAFAVLLPRVHDDGHEPTRVAIRYMFTNVYNAVSTRLGYPLRVFGVNLTNGSYDPHEDEEDEEGEGDEQGQEK